MSNPNNVTVGTLTDYGDGVPGELFSIDLFDLGELDGSDEYAVRKDAANYGSKTRCGKIIRRFNCRTNELPERYLKRIYQLLSEECSLAQTPKQVRFLNGGRLVPTRDGKSVAYEFEVGTYDGYA